MVEEVVVVVIVKENWLIVDYPSFPSHPRSVMQGRLCKGASNGDGDGGKLADCQRTNYPFASPFLSAGVTKTKVREV